MSTFRFSGIVGRWVIGLCVTLLVLSLGVAIYALIRRKQRKYLNDIIQQQQQQQQQQQRYSIKSHSSLNQQKRYALVGEFGSLGTKLVNTQQNQVQPPNRHDAKMNRLNRTNNYTRTLRRIIR